MLRTISVCLAALYLRGLHRAVPLPRRRWVHIEACLRASDCSIEAGGDSLRAQGFWEEAMVLDDPMLLEEAQRLVDARLVLTAADDQYPRRWMERLSHVAPPALWLQGSMANAALVGIVGSRQIEPQVREFAYRVGADAVRLGYAVVSGGAFGCDLAGEQGAIDAGGQVVEILPHGIDQFDRHDRCGLSVCAPDEIFSTASAMERNALIYAASERTVVVEARFKQGGTWIGAAEAIRRRLCPLIVRDDGSQASRALIGLGATPIADPTQLAVALADPAVQQDLFGAG